MSYLREKIVMPEIGPIRWRKDGYGTQVLRFSSGGDCPPRRSEDLRGEIVPSTPIQRGYVKIWRDGPERRVVDRALTVKAARRRIEQLKQAEALI